MTPSESLIIQSAIGWWEGHRPRNFTESEHLANPAINTCSSAEEHLASVVATVVAERRTKPWRNTK